MPSDRTNTTYINGRTLDPAFFQNKEYNLFLNVIFSIPVFALILYSLISSNKEKINKFLPSNENSEILKLITFTGLTILLFLTILGYLVNIPYVNSSFQITTYVLIALTIMFFNYTKIIGNAQVVDNTQVVGDAPVVGNMSTQLITILGASIFVLIFLGNGIFKTDLFEGLGVNSETNEYNANKYDVTYHDSIADLISQKSITGVTHAVDENGVLTEFVGPIEQNRPYFNKPSTYTYAMQTYVPNYEESVYLSKSNGVQKEIIVSEYIIPDPVSNDLASSTY
jgi:hypothetical protein